MTDREKVEQDLARAQRGRRLLKGAALVFCVGAFAVSLTLGALNYFAIEKVSACEENPTGQRCQTVRRRTDRAQSIRDKCRNFWRVGYPCPKPGSRADRRFSKRQAAAARGGDAFHQPASSGHQQPAPSTGGANHGGGSGKKTAPSPSGGASEPPAAPATPSGPGNSEGAGSSEESSANPIAEGAGKAVEGIGATVGGVVKETGEGVNNAVEGVGK